MNGNPPVSVYIVTYLTSEERCGVLLQTCRDALALRYPDFEVVVSDNGGPFAASDALRSLNDPRLKVCPNETNEGFTGNINRCLTHCSHDIIKLMCDDDLIHPDFLQQTVPLLDEDTLVVVDVEKFAVGHPPASIQEEYTALPEHDIRPPGYDARMWNISFKSSCIPSATLLTRTLFARLGGYDPETITSDWDFFTEACLHARIIHVRKQLCYVGVWPGSLTEEMLAKPYFFPHEALYTKFRVYHCKRLKFRERVRFLGMMAREFMLQGSRVLKHIGNPVYHTGYRDYRARFFKMLRQSRTEFTPRPSNS